MKPGRDLWWHELMADASRRLPRRAARQRASALHPLHLRLHRQAQGHPAHHRRLPARHVADAPSGSSTCKEDDIYWCTADIGWVTGHSYIVYGPLANGATVVMYEGAPNWPDEDRFWEIIEKYRVTIFYTAPTAIRAFIKWGDQWPEAARPVEPAPAGHGRRADQSRGVDVVSRGHRRRPLPDRRYLVADRDRHDHDRAAAGRDRRPSRARRRGRCPASSPTSSTSRASRVPANQGGFLVIRKPWPAMLRTHLRRRRALQAAVLERRSPACYFTGDGARRDEDGYFWIMGRVDDVLNVAGHRLSTMEVESALVHHPKVAEAAVVGKPDEIKGEGIACFVTLEAGVRPTEELKKELREHVVKEIGALARPDEIRFTDSLPKTRCGKIMRRLLRDIAGGRQTTGDTTTLEDLQRPGEAARGRRMTVSRRFAEAWGPWHKATLLRSVANRRE